MDRGYVCLWRKTIESAVFKNDGLFKVWIWCLMKANHKEAHVSMKIGRGETIVKVSPGQFIFGRYSAAKELGMEPSTLWQRLKKLKSTQNIDIKSNSKYSVISIINWDIYQSQKNNCDSKSDRQVTGKRQASDTNNNDKNVNNEKKKGDFRYTNAVPLPKDFYLTDKMKEFAVKKRYGADLEAFTEQFMIKVRARGDKYKDWYAAWQNWLINDMRFHPDHVEVEMGVL